MTYFDHFDYTFIPFKTYIKLDNDLQFRFSRIKETKDCFISGIND